MRVPIVCSRKKLGLQLKNIFIMDQSYHCFLDLTEHFEKLKQFHIAQVYILKLIHLSNRLSEIHKDLN